MALNLAPFITDLRAVLAATWPEATAIWDAEHINRIPWLDVEPPYGVILIDRLPRAEWGAANLAFQPPVQLFYVASTEGKSVSLLAKLADLTNALWPTDPLRTNGNGQVYDVGDIRVDDGLFPNQVFTAANRAQRAGMVLVEFIVGTPNQ